MDDSGFKGPKNAGTTSEILKRIYHEDNLFAERTWYFITANAFLAVALATLLLGAPQSGVNARFGELAIIGLSLFMAYFYLAVGRRHAIAIAFWRRLEASGATEVKDSWQRDFYQNGWVAIPIRDSNGNPTLTTCVIRAVPRREESAATGQASGSVYAAVPWRYNWVGSTNDVLGVLVPWSMAIFWIIYSLVLTTPAPQWAPWLPWTTVSLAAVSLPIFLWSWINRAWVHVESFTDGEIIELTQTGLPTGLTWSVTFRPDPGPWTSKACDPIRIRNLRRGRHQYWVKIPCSDSWWLTQRYSGHIDTGDHATVEFTQTDPVENTKWEVSIDPKSVGVKVTANGPRLTYALPNGSYLCNVDSVSGYDVPPSRRIQVWDLHCTARAPEAVGNDRAICFNRRVKGGSPSNGFRSDGG